MPPGAPPGSVHRDAAPAVLAQVVRGGFVESVHAGHAVVVGPDGRVLFAAGEPDAQILPRSASKPLQALASVTAGAPLSGGTLAIGCASHAGEPFHLAAVDAVLAASGLDRTALGNVAAMPRAGEAYDTLVREGRGPEPVLMNCSGKHAAMLAACVASGWPTGGYQDPEHPLQRHVFAVVREYTSVPIHHVVVDGCGVPCPSTTPAGLARAMSRLVTAAAGTPERAVTDAMRHYPAHVGGTGHANTRFMELIPGSVAKGGAEGVLVATLADGTSAAVKCADGASRAVTAVAMAALRAAGADLPPLPELEVVPVSGGGATVGHVAVTVGVPAGEAARG